MEFGLEEAALASNVDVSVPADAESTRTWCEEIFGVRDGRRVQAVC